jgi:hypothetical protein
MYHYMQIDPSLIRERNERMRAEMSKLRLEKRLREEHGSSSSRFVALAKWGVMPLLREIHLKG